MDLDDLVLAHRPVACVAQRWGEPGLHLWYADLGVEVNQDWVSYHCPSCGQRLRTCCHEFVYSEGNATLICGLCRGDVEERAGALD